MAQYEDLKIDPHQVDKYLLPKDEEIRIRLRQASEINPTNNVQIPENTATIQESKTPQWYLNLKDAYDGSLLQGLTKTVGTAALGAFGLNKVGKGLAFLDRATRANKYLNAGRTLVDAGLSLDGLRNLTTDNGVQKTIREAKAGNTWNAVKSGVGDVLDASIWRYTKPFSTLVKDFKFATNAIKDFKNAPIKTQIGQSIYNFSRIPIRFGINISGVKNIVNPVLYKLALRNSGNHAAKLVDVIKGGNGVVDIERLRPAYRQSFLANTIWEDMFPSGLKLNKSEEARKAFDYTHRYKNLPIFELPFEINGLANANIKGTKNIKENLWRTVPFDEGGNNSRSYIRPKINIGGHGYKEEKLGENLYKASLRDVQHYSPIEYVNKWGYDTNKIGKAIRGIKVGVLDLFHNDFGLYNSKLFTLDKSKLFKTKTMNLHPVKEIE